MFVFFACLYVFVILCLLVCVFLALARWYMVVHRCVFVFFVFQKYFLLHIAPARWFIVVAVRLSAAADVDRDRACQLQLSPGMGNFFGTKLPSFETKN